MLSWGTSKSNSNHEKKHHLVYPRWRGLGCGISMLIQTRLCVFCSGLGDHTTHPFLGGLSWGHHWADGSKTKGKEGGKKMMCKQLMHLWQSLKSLGWFAFCYLMRTLCSVHTVSPERNATQANWKQNNKSFFLSSPSVIQTSLYIQYILM